MRKKQLIASLVIAGTLLMPSQIYAKGGHAGHSSHVSHSSHISSHVSKSTTVKSTIKSSKPDSAKFSTKKSSSNNKSSKSTVTKKTTINITKHYTVKPKKTIHYINTNPTYYTHYSNRPIYYNQGLGFWDYYMLSSIFKDKKEVTDRDIARELESRGYSNQEIDKILKEAKQEQQKDKGKKKESFWRNILKWIGIIAFIAVIVVVVIFI